MIYFFKIKRWQSIKDHKSLKYSKYVLGEIFIVIIGILIALQINNWNTQRKLIVKEIKALQNVKLSLGKDFAYRQQTIDINNRTRNSMEYIIDHMEKDLPYEDSLKYHFSLITMDWGLEYDFSSYESLKSVGFSLISNDSLRSNIISYYSYAESWGSEGPKRYSNVLERASETIFIKHFEEMWNTQNGMIPLDYELLKKDNEFRYFLKTLRNQNYWMIDHPIERISAKFIKISNDIDQEIIVLKK